MPNPFERRRLVDALNGYEPQAQPAPQPDAVIVPTDVDEAELRRLYAANPRTPVDQPPISDTDYAHFPQGHPMRMEYDRQRQEAMGMFQKLLDAYQRMRGRR